MVHLPASYQYWASWYIGRLFNTTAWASWYIGWLFNKHWASWYIGRLFNKTRFQDTLGGYSAIQNFKLHWAAIQLFRISRYIGPLCKNNGLHDTLCGYLTNTSFHDGLRGYWANSPSRLCQILLPTMLLITQSMSTMSSNITYHDDDNKVNVYYVI